MYADSDSSESEDEDSLDALAQASAKIVDGVLSVEYISQTDQSQLINLIYAKFSDAMMDCDDLDFDARVEATENLKSILVERGFNPSLVDAEVPMNPLAASEVSDSVTGSEPSSPYPQEGLLDFSVSSPEHTEASSAQPEPADSKVPSEKVDAKDPSQDLNTEKEVTNKRRKLN